MMFTENIPYLGLQFGFVLPLTVDTIVDFPAPSNPMTRILICLRLEVLLAVRLTGEKPFDVEFIVFRRVTLAIPFAAAWSGNMGGNAILRDRAKFVGFSINDSKNDSTSFGRAVNADSMRAAHNGAIDAEDLMAPKVVCSWLSELLLVPRFAIAPSLQ